MEFNELFEVVRAALPVNNRVYLVGGAVRDKILGRSIHDLDFGMFSGTKKTALAVAHELNSPFFMLDEQRLAARVIFRPVENEVCLLDFVTLVGEDLQTDLRLRDFTINAMAIDVRDPLQLIDPCGGFADLQDGIIRACSPSAMEDDPLRILRGVRLAASFDFKILPGTEDLMRAGAASIGRISAERLRDELFKILDGKEPEGAIERLDSLNVLKAFLPEVTRLKGVRQSDPHVHEVWPHTLRTLHYLDLIVQGLSLEHSKAQQIHPAIVKICQAFNPFRQNILDQLNGSPIPGRPQKSLLFLAALLHDNAKSLTWSMDQSGKIHNYGHEQFGSEAVAKRGKDLALGNIEVDYLERVVANHMRIHSLAQTKNLPSRRAIYRFFRDTRKAGVDICLLSLADTLATYENTLPEQVLQVEIDICTAMLEAWWRQPTQSIDPPKLLTGDDLKVILNLKPGKLIGNLLSSLYEAQASGEVTNREEALAFVREQLNTLEQ